MPLKYTAKNNNGSINFIASFTLVDISTIHTTTSPHEPPHLVNKEELLCKLIFQQRKSILFCNY